MYILIPRATTKKIVQNNIQKNHHKQSEWNSKIYLKICKNFSKEKQRNEQQ